LAAIWLYLVLILRYWALFGLVGPYLNLTVKQKRNSEGPHRGHRITEVSTFEDGSQTNIKLIPNMDFR